MAQPMTPKSIRNLGVYGVIRQAEVDDSLIPDGAVTEVVNFSFDRKGAATVRSGLKSIGTSGSIINYGVGYPVYGMHGAVSSFLLVAAFDTGPSPAVLRYSPESNTWASILSPTTSARIRFVDFSGFTVAFSGTYDSVRVNTSRNVYTSLASSNTTINPDQLTTTATGQLRPKYGEVYKSRMYLSGDVNKPSRLFYSSVIDITGAITWSPNSDYVDINPGDGEDITALKRYSLELLVFKPNYTYRFRTAGLDPDPLIRVGTRSQESVLEGKRGVYFHHQSGFYRYTGGYPEEISRPISDIVAAIPFSQFSGIVGWKDEDHIHWSIGNITVQEGSKSVTYKNCVIRYTESSGIWTVYSYPSDVRAAAPYVQANASTIIIGMDNGLVGQFNVGTTDFGEPIKFRVSTPWFEWEGIENRKTIQLIVALAEKGMGANLSYQVNSEDSDWIGFKTDLRSPVSVFDQLSVKFNRIRFRISGVSTLESSVFRGLEIPQGINEGFIKQWQK